MKNEGREGGREERENEKVRQREEREQGEGREV